MGVARRLTLAAALLAVLPLAIGDGPARAAAPVQGIHQTYQGFRFTGAAPPKIAYDDWWFDGTPVDQLTKLTPAPTAAITHVRPTDPGIGMQTGVPGTIENPDVYGNALTLSWQGPYHGLIDGDVQLRWFWASANVAAQLGAAVEVTFFADPQPALPATILGRKVVNLEVGPEPILNVNQMYVSGTIDRVLAVQVRPVYVDASTELRAVYGSADYPSGFRIPPPRLSAVAQGKPYSVAIPDRGPMLEVQASWIGRDASEPTIGVAKDGTAYYASLSDDDSPAGATTVMRSTDGGVNWDPVSPKLPDGATNDPPATADPYVYVDPTTGRVFTVDLYAGCSHMLFSDDKGKSWTRSPLSCGKPVNDHQTIVAGPPPKGVVTNGYPNMLYYCVNQVIDSDCGRSFDGGLTWEPTPSLAYVGLDPERGGLCGGIHGHVRVDREGRVYVPKGHCGFPWVAVSEDAGATWKQVQVSTVPAGGFHTNIATDDEGNVFYVWWDETWKLPWLSVSRDHGSHWSPAIMIAPPGVEAVNFPSISAGNAGRIAINFPGSTVKRADPYRPWNSYVVVSTNALDRVPVFQSTTANPPDDPIHRGDCDSRCGRMLDFMDIHVATTGEAWATAVDTCLEECIANSEGPEPPGGVSSSADGLAVRQLCGPALRGPARPLPRAGCRDAGR